MIIKGKFYFNDNKRKIDKTMLTIDKSIFAPWKFINNKKSITL